jgi:hypothetical protein
MVEGTVRTEHLFLTCPSLQPSASTFPQAGRIFRKTIMTPFLFQRGETISLALDAVTGDPVSVTGVTAKLKAVPPGRTTVPDGAPVAATFAVVPRAAQGDVPAGWTLTIPANVSAGLGVGSYLADARLDVGSGTIVTDSIAIRLRASVSA